MKDIDRVLELDNIKYCGHFQHVIARSAKQTEAISSFEIASPLTSLMSRARNDGKAKCPIILTLL